MAQHRLTQYQIEYGRHKHLVNSMRKNLMQQEKLGNLSEMGSRILNMKGGVESLIGEIEASRKIARASGQEVSTMKQETIRFTKTGYLMKEVTNKSGKTYVRYGKGLDELYQAALNQKAINPQTMKISRTYKFTTKKYTGRQWEEEVWNADLSSREAFIKSLSTRSVIALRIELFGEERDDVLKDYGY